MSFGASAIYFLDHKGKVIISRDYRGDIPKNVSESITRKMLELDD
jgi:AP-1 complex subunit mu